MYGAGPATVAPQRCKVEPSEGRVALDNPDSKYRDYFVKVHERIKRYWAYPREAGERGIEGNAQIDFDIAQDGRLAFIALRNSSGVKTLDDYALAAVKLAQPFPPVPDSVSQGPLRVSGAFCYRTGQGRADHTVR